MQCADCRIRTCETTIMALHLMHDQLQQACDCFLSLTRKKDAVRMHQLWCGHSYNQHYLHLDVLLYMAIYVDIAGG